MLSPAHEGVGHLLGLLTDRRVADWTPFDQWLRSLPAHLGDPHAVAERAVAAGLVEIDEREQCRRCAQAMSAHDEADHPAEPSPRMVRVREAALAASVAQTLADTTGASIAAPRRDGGSPTFAADGVSAESERFMLVLHFGDTRAGLPQTQGEPLIVADFRGAPALPNPPAIQFHWTELLADAAVRERALAHVSLHADTSVLSLQDIVAGLDQPEEAKDALRAFLLARGFHDARDDPGNYVDAARIGFLITRWYRRDADLLVECTCKSRLGWHLHGYLRGQRVGPLTLVPELAAWTNRAAQAAGRYRALIAQGKRTADRQDPWKNIAAVGTLLGGLGTLSQEDLTLPALGVQVSGDVVRVVGILLLLLGGAILLPVVVGALTRLRLARFGWPRR